MRKCTEVERLVRAPFPNYFSLFRVPHISCNTVGNDSSFRVAMKFTANLLKPPNCLFWQLFIKIFSFFLFSGWFRFPATLQEMHLFEHLFQIAGSTDADALGGWAKQGPLDGFSTVTLSIFPGSALLNPFFARSGSRIWILELHIED